MNELYLEGTSDDGQFDFCIQQINGEFSIEYCDSEYYETNDLLKSN